MIIAKIRHLLWRILGIDYQNALKTHDYVFLENDTNTVIGENTYNNGAYVFRWTTAELKIGKYCSIANGVRFILDEGYHGESLITSYPLVSNLFKSKELVSSNVVKEDFLSAIDQRAGITVGNDVWLGMGVLIMPGVNIGNGATIAANSVVTKDVPSYSVIAGVPGKVIKKKFTQKQIDALNTICWWDWEKDVVKNNIKDFYSLSIEEFIRKNLNNKM